MKRYVLKVPNDSLVAKLVCVAFASSLVLVGFFMEPPGEIFKGLWLFITSRAVLITDYFALGSIGAAFVNAGLVMFISIGLTLLTKAPYNGATVAALFLMPGFALFGKNPVNILPFFLGVFLYARYCKEPMKKHTSAALYSTTLAPIVSDLMLLTPYSLPVRLLLAFAAGVIIGFVIVPLAKHMLQMHRGYNMFNYGFVSGIIAYLYTSIATARGLDVRVASYWHLGVDRSVLIFLLAVCAILFLLGGFFGGWRLRKYLHIMRPHGHATHDLILSDGIGVTMVNMSVVGLLCLGYILLIGGDLSGPVLGAIFTAIGFSATGAHPRNIAPIMFGVWIASSPDITAHATNPVIQLAAVFGAVALAPIAGEFGPFMGIIAGLLHFPLVYSTGGGTGGFNLYNNGFAAGLVAAIMVILLHTFLPRFGVVTQRRIMRVLLLNFRKHPHPHEAVQTNVQPEIPNRLQKAFDSMERRAHVAQHLIDDPHPAAQKEQPAHERAAEKEA
ncbi:DUF1576 domain-containing protein [Eubacteriales bacterium OttesenSCG-928-K08]|nr:DUF1576 domain-containing protein [Eubacteriales bacterium OttesenSCG-928-K08]